MDIFESARRKYLPKPIKYLLITEAPPKIGSDRFFYFENVRNYDSLFLEIINVLYPEDTNRLDIYTIRSLKKVFLDKFKSDGFYLIDSLENPFETKVSEKIKIKTINNGIPKLITHIESLINETTKIILISSTVYYGAYISLLEYGFNVVNMGRLVFPSAGWQKTFRTDFADLLIDIK